MKFTDFPSGILTPARGISILCTLFLAAGCHSIGPSTIARDRFDYSAALSSSWKNQMLLNLVKTRYLDLPIYLEVGQIVSGYTLATGVSISGQASPQSLRGDTFGSLGASGTYTDRPTITYSPLTGEKFLQSLLTPIHPAKVMSLVQAGYAADFIMQMTVDSLNGLRNQPVSVNSKHKSDPEFFRVLSLLREVQDAGAFGMKVEEPTNGQPAAVFFFRDDQIDSVDAAKIDEIRSLLGLTGDQSAFRLVQSPLRGRHGELGITTRSLMQVMAALSLGVEVPEKHALRKLTPPMAAQPPPQSRMMRIHSGTAKPDDTFVAVRYEEEWFWISNDDWGSKRTFSSILFLFTLVNSGNEQQLPTITIPAQ